MSSKKKRFQSKDPLSSIPNFVKTPEGVFDDIEHYRTVAERITFALSSKGNRKSCATISGSSLYDGIRIIFSTEYKEEEIFLDNLQSKIVLMAPKKKNESEASLQSRRMYYFDLLLRPVEAMKTSGISYVYLSLKEEGRQQISRRSRKKRGGSR